MDLRNHGLLGLTAATFGLSLLASATAQTQFTDATQQSGIAFTHSDRIDTMAGGLCFLDYDQDGDQDLFVTARSASNKLYRNDGSGRFTDATASAGVGDVMETMAAYAQDLDGDGLTDLLVLARFFFRFYRNNGDGTFTDQAARSTYVRPGWPVSATFSDYDHDGDLDVYVGNYVGMGFFPNFDGIPNQLLRNEGGFVFQEVTQQAGVGGEERIWDASRNIYRNTAGCTLSVLFHDYDGDGWDDLLVGNDFGPFVVPNQLFRNDGTGRFTEVGRAANFRIAEFNMGLTVADVNGDGFQDVYTSNFGDNHLLFNDGRGRYWDAAPTWNAVEGTSAGKFLVSWAAMFLDADLDAAIDLYVSNGYVQTAPTMDNDRNAPSRLLRHAGGRYEIVPETQFPWDRDVGRGAACADIDGDGDEDIVQLNNRGPLKVYRNDTVTSNSAAILALHGTVSNRDGVGAMVDIRTRNGRQQQAYVRGGSYSSGNGAALIRGLGADQRIEELETSWPSGVVSHRFGLDANQPVEVVEPSVTVASVGRWVPLGTEFVEVPVSVHNHASAARAVTFGAKLVTPEGQRYEFPAYHFPVTLGADAQTTVSVFLPIPAGVVPVGRSLGLWYQISVEDVDGGRDEAENPIR